MRRWADAGLEILHRTSAAVGLPPTARRHGYRVVRRGSRYSVFPRAAVSELADAGELPARRVGGEWRFARAAILSWLGQTSS